MRNNMSAVVLGLIFIAAGVVYFGNSFFDWGITIFFNGWWTLFLIVPGILSIIKTGPNVGNLVLTGVGIFLLLRSLDVIKDFWAGCVPGGLVLIGAGIIFQSVRSNKAKGVVDVENYTPCDAEGNPVNREDDGTAKGAPKAGKDRFDAFFGGVSPNYNGKEFFGCRVSAVFGGAELNLKNAVIRKNCTISAAAIFGGVDIALPPNVRAVVVGTPVLGGWENKHTDSLTPGAPVVYIKATCVLGGIDVI